MKNREPRVNVFFYGSFINVNILARNGFVVEELATGKVWGFDIRISTLATLVPSDQECVYGIVCKATHAELNHLYGQAWLGGVYQPQAVIVERQDGMLTPALCYVAHTEPPARPSEEYINWILGPANDLGFPNWYIDRLRTWPK